MSRYIDADKLKEKMMYAELSFKDNRPTKSFNFYKAEDVDAQTAADVVEVVRCKDCKYHNNRTEFCKQWSVFGTVKSDRNDFCSYGERAEA